MIRRVDENWAEGKLDGRIGIFPLTFVELNNLARSLMKLSTKQVFARLHLERAKIAHLNKRTLLF